MNPSSEWIEHEDQRLHIVDDQLWRCVQSRLVRQAASVGARVKAGLSRKAAATGREPRHLFSGWLTCGLCGARFTLVNRRSYACASHVNGLACSNTLHVRRDLVESRLLAGIRKSLGRPEIAAEIERRVRSAGLRTEVENLVNAIAQGGLRNSPALGRTLRELEADLKALESGPAANQVVIPALSDIRR